MTLVSRTLQPLPPRPLSQRAVVKPFEAMSEAEKAKLSVKTAGQQLPEVARGLWANKKAVMAGIVAPYTHPVKSWAAANDAVAAAAKEDPLEAALTVAKNHGALLTAWAFPLTLAMAPATGGASLVAALGTLGLGATLVSLGKNVIDASQAESRDDLESQSEQILADTLELIPNAAISSVSRALPMEEFVPSSALRSRAQVMKAVTQSVDQADLNQYKEEQAVVTLLGRLRRP